MAAIESGAPREHPRVPRSDAMFRGPLNRLIGREHELAAIEALLSDPDLRLLTLSGPPGIGKTRLAMALASRARDRGETNVWFVPLASVSEPELVLPSIGNAIGSNAAGGPLVFDELERKIADTRVLLVLDNFEQLLPAAGDVLELLTRCTQLKIVVTSRAVLGLRCEREWKVAPLAVPTLERKESVDRVSTFPSVALLIERAKAADQDFVLSDANVSAIASICVQLEGIPLAIELAATWLKVHSPSMLLGRLQQGISALQGAAIDMSPRQRTMHDAIAWSDELLTALERRLFHRLSVFPGGWTLEAAERVCWSDGEGASIDEVMLGLVNKNLVIRRPLDDQPARFRMLAMIRAYAYAQLEYQHAAERFRSRHAEYIGELCLEAREHLYRNRQALWLERLEREHANIRAALRWLIDCGQREAALRLVANLENFWILHDHLFEGQRWLEEILAMRGEASWAAEVAGRASLAAVLLRKGEFHPVRRLLDQNLEQANEIGDEVLAAETVHTLGISYWHAGDLGHSRLLFEHALQLARQAGDERVIARVLNHLGGTERFAGCDLQALTYYEESLAIWRTLADQERIAMVLHNMGPVVARIGERERAAALFAESLETSSELRNAHGVALCLMGIAGTVSESGSSSVQAARLLAAAESLRRGIGVRWDPDDRAEFERSTTTVRGLLDPTTFEAAWQQGASLSLDDAIVLGNRQVQSLANASPKLLRSHGQLTRREREIAIHVSLGQTNREIANVLSIAEKTVEMHIGHSLTKLGFRSRAQLAAWIAEQSFRGVPKPQVENTG